MLAALETVQVPMREWALSVAPGCGGGIGRRRVVRFLEKNEQHEVNGDRDQYSQSRIVVGSSNSERLGIVCERGCFFADFGGGFGSDSDGGFATTANVGGCGGGGCGGCCCGCGCSCWCDCDSRTDSRPGGLGFACSARTFDCFGCFLLLSSGCGTTDCRKGLG